MKAPKITVLVPSIGRMDYLWETRRCVREQTRTDFQVLVLDNASPAEARAFFEAWAREDARVQIRRVDPRLPMFENFNRGIVATKTEFVTFFHDDDVYDPRFLEVLVGALEEHPRAAFAGSNNEFIDARGAVTEQRRWIRRSEFWDDRKYIGEVVGRGRNVIPMQGIVFRRDAFGPTGFDTTLPIHYGDFVLLMRAAEGRGMVVVAESVVRIRRHAAQASAIPLSRSIALRREVLAAYLDEYPTRTPDETSFVRRLRRRVALAHRVGMVWGWLIAPNDEEQAACLASLGDESIDGLIRTVLGTAASRGLRPNGVGARAVRVARTAAELLRL